MVQLAICVFIGLVEFIKFLPYHAQHAQQSIILLQP